MDTDKLRYFVTIAECGSLTKASELLNISHSGLSKAVSSLESELDYKLFRPQGRGLEITNEGKAFYQKASEILKLVTELKTTKKTDLSTPLRIGISQVLANYCLSPLAKEISGKVDFVEVEVGEIEKKILSGEMDFAFAFVPSPHSEIDYLKIGKISFSAIARKTLKSENIPFVAPLSEYPTNPMNYRHRDGWPLGFARDVQYTVGTLAMALSLVKEGVCAVYMPIFIAHIENESLSSSHQLVELEAYEKAKTARDLFLIKAKNTSETPSMKKASKILRNICRL